MRPIQTLTPESFTPYGYLLTYDPLDHTRFQIKVSEKQTVGWRMAVKKINGKFFDSIQKHPDTMESFTPLQGVTIVAVARPESPENFELFLLDQPICLGKNVWHAMICLSEQSLVEITENLEAQSDSFQLGKKISVYAD